MSASATVRGGKWYATTLRNYLSCCFIGFVGFISLYNFGLWSGARLKCQYSSNEFAYIVTLREISAVMVLLVVCCGGCGSTLIVQAINR